MYTVPERASSAWVRTACLLLALGALEACGGNETIDSPDGTPGPAAATEAMLAAEMTELTIDDSSFGCLEDMTGVRHFFVDNLLGDLEATIAVAESTDGGVYPPGSVVQLVPTEAMVKHPPGHNPATRDWEFFELAVTAEGSRINTRGFTEVVNRFGGNCFGCHVQAEPQYDLICELDHGCDPIPVTREQIAAVQAADPRCSA